MRKMIIGNKVVPYQEFTAQRHPEGDTLKEDITHMVRDWQRKRKEARYV